MTPLFVVTRSKKRMGRDEGECSQPMSGIRKRSSLVLTYLDLKQQKEKLKDVVNTFRHLEEVEPEMMQMTSRDLELINQLK